MPHLVRERRVVSGFPPPPRERRNLHRIRRRIDPIPESDLLDLALTGIVYRLAQFGLDADAGPLLSGRKRGM